MSDVERIYYHRATRRDAWEPVTVSSRSIVGWNLQHYAAGEIYQTDDGHEYKWEAA